MPDLRMSAVVHGGAPSTPVADLFSHVSICDAVSLWSWLRRCVVSDVVKRYVVYGFALKGTLQARVAQFTLVEELTPVPLGCAVAGHPRFT